MYERINPKYLFQKTIKKMKNKINEIQEDNFESIRQICPLKTQNSLEKAIYDSSSKQGNKKQIYIYIY